MRITNDGNMVYCRWTEKLSGTVNIRDVDPREFFQQHMAPLRQQLLQGNQLAGCNECYQMEQHGKISGRQRQLLKTGVQLQYFDKSVVSSPWYQHWSQNYQTGVTDQLPQDWQIDLGNYCNSSCVFCSPSDSSRLAAEWKSIGLIQQMPLPNWTDDPALVKKFIDVIKQSRNIQYLHFIGGETIITPAFKTLLKSLIETGLNKTATVGFTTNLTVWNQEIADLLCEFSGVNLGMSVEAFDKVNDYIRWPSKLEQTIESRDRWIKLGREQNWLMQFRTTPTMLSVSKLLSIYQYAYQEKISVESCNFLQRPDYLRPSVLPRQYRDQCINQMQQWLTGYQFSNEQVVNTRNPHLVQQQIMQDLQSYVNYFVNEPDESYRLPDAVKFLKLLESSRKNTVLDYLPEYEELFRSAGY